MLKRILSNSAVYFGASMAASGISFLALPIYTRLLSPEDFGVLGLIAAGSGILGTIIGLSPQLYFSVEFKKSDAETLKKSAAAALAVPLLSAPVAVVALMIFRGSLGMSEVPMWTFVAMVLLPIFANARTVYATASRMQERPWRVAGMQLGSVIVEHSTALLLLLLVVSTWQLRYAATLLAAVGMGIAAIILLRKGGLFGFSCSKEVLRNYLRFLLPLVPHALGYWAVNAQDRFFIGRMCSIDDVGYYSVAYRLCGIFPIVTGAVLGAFNPYLYKKTLQDEEKTGIVRFSYLYLTAVAGLFLLFVFVVVPLTPWLLGERFASGVQYLPWIGGAYAVGAVRDLSVGYLYRASKNRLIGSITLFAAVLNGVLNYFLIRQMGAVGAAAATFATFVAIAAITAWFGLRAVPMPWLSPFKKAVRKSSDDI